MRVRVRVRLRRRLRVRDSAQPARADAAVLLEQHLVRGGGRSRVGVMVRVRVRDRVRDGAIGHGLA